MNFMLLHLSNIWSFVEYSEVTSEYWVPSSEHSAPRHQRH
jgi:hypothetical protein